jgi:hypothetical protein
LVNSSSTPHDLDQLASAVSSRTELYEFICALKSNFILQPELWENDNVQDYLEGMSGFVLSLDGWHKNFGVDGSAEIPTWATFARILLAATICE